MRGLDEVCAERSDKLACAMKIKSCGSISEFRHFEYSCRYVGRCENRVKLIRCKLIPKINKIVICIFVCCKRTYAGRVFTSVAIDKNVDGICHKALRKV